MAECPFCKGSISEDIASYGGRCPHCLIEIPGEEAPTNPGQDAVARQAAEEAAANASSRRRVAFALVAAFMLTVVGGTAFVLTRPEAPDPDAANGFEDFVMVPLDKHQTLAKPEGEEAEEVVASSGRSGRSGRSSGSGANSSGGASSAGSSSAGSGGPVASAGGSTVEDHQSASLLGTSVGSSAGPNIGLELGTGPSIGVKTKGPEAIVLKDTEAIREMVQMVLKTGGSSLKSCYESEIKNDDALRGTWEISFSLNRKGTAQSIDIQPLSVSNPQLESCMQQKVAKWTFVPIENPIRIVKNFSFQSGW